MKYPIYLSRFFVLFLGASLVLSACKKQDQLIYEVNEVDSRPLDAEKTTLKSESQYLSILYANLFQEALSASEVVELSELVESVGDKETIREVIISSFMNSPDKILPSPAEMRSDIDAFVEETYIRFLVRHPTQAEIAWFRNFIEADPDITPEMVYMAFALSDEYLFY